MHPQSLRQKSGKKRLVLWGRYLQGNLSVFFNLLLLAYNISVVKSVVDMNSVC